MGKVELIKNKFNREEFNKIIDINFNELSQPPPIEEESEWDINKFFEEYEKLFFRIPEEGEFNSHEYLVRKSGDYINYDKVNEAIQSLLEEITDLRLQILELTQENINLKNPHLNKEEIKRNTSEIENLIKNRNINLNNIQKHIKSINIQKHIKSTQHLWNFPSKWKP